MRAIAAALPHSPGLEMLFLDGNRFGIEGTKAFAAALPLCRLLRLTMQNNDLGEEGARTLIDVAPRSNLTMMYLGRDSLPIRAALIRGVANRQLFAFAQGILAAAGTPVENFVRRDGDHALGHRVAGFLVE
jgi:hypothetical protein